MFGVTYAGLSADDQYAGIMIIVQCALIFVR